MRAVICHELKGPDALTLQEVPSPALKPGHLLIDVKAASLNFPDILITWGKYQMKPDLPFTPGGEGAGVVTEVGEGVKGFKPGDRVIFMTGYGAFAEQVAVPAMVCMPVPDTMDYKTAAALTLTYGTSLHALRQRANLQPGETLVVLGAAGGVGLAAVQLGKAMGARVIACASSDEKLAVCKAAGADELINYSSEDLKARLKELTGKKGIDVAYDPVGGDFSEAVIRCMGAGGRFLVIGFAAGDIPKIPLNLTLLKQCQIVGVFWGAWTQMDPAGHFKNMKDLFDMCADYRISPLVDDVFNLDSFKEAYACLSERKVKGKVVLEMV